MAQYARREDRPDRAKCVPVLHRWEVPLRAAGDPPGQGGRGARASRAGMRPPRPHCAQEEREPDGSPSSCESPSPLSGRAARVKLGDAFHLPPNRCCDRQGIGCHPRGARCALRARPAPGWSVAFTETTGLNHTSSALPPPGSGAKRNCRDVIANQIFPQNVDKICLRSRAPVTAPWRW